MCSRRPLIALPFIFAFLFLSSGFLAGQGKPGKALWLRYPAISPDGKSIAFSYQGNLFLVPRKGGPATALTHGSHYSFRPVWAPDGQSLVFASDAFGNLDLFHVSVHGGEAKRLTFHSADDTPSGFSPDGKWVLFSSTRRDAIANVQFPSRRLSELYRVPIAGGRVEQVLTTPAEEAAYSPDGSTIAYHDVKGYENAWRKHHESSIARDLWTVDVESGHHRKLTSYRGEDRQPVWSKDGQTLSYLSEQSGSFNIWQLSLEDPDQPRQITHHEKHPVRFLSQSREGDLCYTYDGEIHLLSAGKKKNAKRKKRKSRTLTITIPVASPPDRHREEAKNGATEMALSPNGKEMAFIVRGEVYVTAVDHSLTKRITHTPEQERSVSFSPDGRTLLYASERSGSWDLYQTRLTTEEETYFYRATVLKEKVVLQNEHENFQPAYAPDGKKIAYLEDRTTLKTLDLESGARTVIVPAERNYSYLDGDQHFAWSPDSRWLLFDLNDSNRWIGEVGLRDAEAKEEIVQLTVSGYEDGAARWMMKGAMMIWFTDRMGMRSHGSWGSQKDVFGMFFDRAAFDRFQLGKADYEILKEREKEKEKDDNKKKPDASEGDKEEPEKAEEPGDKEEDKKPVEPLKLDLEHLEERTVRLTLHPSNLADATLTSDGSQLLYLARFEKGHDLWLHKPRERETRLLAKLGANGGALQLDEKEKHVFVMAGGKITRVEIETGKQKAVSFEAPLDIDLPSERAYLFEHVWRQAREKFYVKDLHGVDWEFYKEAYQRFLPHITNNRDFSELLSELLGELNASHTGSGYRHRDATGDQTASLGAWFDPNHEGNGLKIVEFLERGPLAARELQIVPGTIIESIDGTPILEDMNYYPLLNDKAGTPVRLGLLDPEADRRWEGVARPITLSRENELRYLRWIEGRRKETDRLSEGKLGYVHIRSMNDASFREFYDQVLGENTGKQALVVDTRFNGGGWLHDDLVTLLGGETYFRFGPRGNRIGNDPTEKWKRPSVVIMSEGNYSNAHMFPLVYKHLKIGKLVGMPVAGTGTAVWWETLQDSTLYFGIPQVGVVDNNGDYLENNELFPDIEVDNPPHEEGTGRDRQLEKAVESLLKDLKEAKQEP
ncbi:MAG: S41 family peptidase [Verrucomicrobiota bacterium]